MQSQKSSSLWINLSLSKKASQYSSYYRRILMASRQVCPGFARFLHRRPARVQELEDIGTRCNRMEVSRVSFAWPIWILSKMIRSLLSKDLPTASELLASVLGVPPVIPRLFDVRRYRLFETLLRYRCSIWCIWCGSFSMKIIYSSVANVLLYGATLSRIPSKRWDSWDMIDASLYRWIQ